MSLSPSTLKLKDKDPSAINVFLISKPINMCSILPHNSGSHLHRSSKIDMKSDNDEENIWNTFLKHAAADAWHM